MADSLDAGPGISTTCLGPRTAIGSDLSGRRVALPAANKLPAKTYPEGLFRDEETGQ